jgi:3-oxoacyl-[acyl-carrier-protein] synthase III
MTATLADLTAHLLDRVALVQRNLGYEPAGIEAEARFADVLDSMGMVEFLALVADDCGVAVEEIEECAGRRFGTVAELAEALRAEGLMPLRHQAAAPVTTAAEEDWAACWLAGVSVRLGGTVQPAAELDAALGRPAGWLEEHADIRQRRVWGEEDPVSAAAEAGRECLARAGALVEEVGALLVTAEAPPLLVGLAAALHHRLGLRPETAALEVGGACTGFLAALWLGQRLLSGTGAVLVVSVEAPSRLLRVCPGAAGEAAALFGDGAAAALLSEEGGGEAVSLGEVVLGADGGAGNLLRVEPGAAGFPEVRMDGGPLAARAVTSQAETVAEVCRRRGLTPADLAGVVAHGGNGRMPAVLARRLGLPPERVWSTTAETGNLGSASLPAAWAALAAKAGGPIAWVTVGAGLTWAGALTGRVGETPRPLQ